MPKPQDPVWLRQFLIWLLPATVLAAAVMLQGTAARQDAQRSAKNLRTLDQLIVHQMPGWSGRDLPLAETAEGLSTVSSVLQFDDHFSRLYARGDTIVTLYVARWNRNKITPRMVGAHTPDTCWIQNGWSRSAREHQVLLDIDPALKLKPAEFGTYHLGRVTNHVYFWHLVGGRSYFYDQSGSHSLTALFKDLVSFGLGQRDEQLFVRLASNVPFDRIRHDPGFHELLRSIALIGVGEAVQHSPSLPVAPGAAAGSP